MRVIKLTVYPVLICMLYEFTHMELTIFILSVNLCCMCVCVCVIRTVTMGHYKRFCVHEFLIVDFINFSRVSHLIFFARINSISYCILKIVVISRLQ